MGSEKSARQEMNVAAIRSGTVIDHIRNDATFKVAEILRLARDEQVVVVGMNLPSGKMGQKGLIKIEGRELTPQEVNKIALIAPQATLSIICDYQVTEKRSVELPAQVEGIVRCFNPSCVTNQQWVNSCFDVMDTDPVSLRCVYCERVMTGSDIILR
jgi:aspartate carbamoyltransferase regulatory subunit